MKRREFITLLGGAVAAWPVAARGQQGDRLRRIGILEPIAGESADAASFDAFRQGLREFGFVEGQNSGDRVRCADGRETACPALVGRVRSASGRRNRRPRGPRGTRGQAATASIPIVMAAISEPLGVGVVASLTHPVATSPGAARFVPELAVSVSKY